MDEFLSKFTMSFTKIVSMILDYIDIMKKNYNN